LDAAGTDVVGLRRSGVAHLGHLDHRQRVYEREEGLRPVHQMLRLLHRAHLRDDLFFRHGPRELGLVEDAAEEGYGP